MKHRSRPALSAAPARSPGARGVGRAAGATPRQGGRETSPRKPIYIAIEERVREIIAAEELGPGDRVPSERALAERLQASRMTVRKSMERLVASGVLERDGTAGTRVAMPRVTRPMGGLAGQGISRVVASAGGTAGTRLLHFEQARASAKMAKRLGVAEGDELVVLRRLLTVNATPFCIETSHIPAALVPGLHAEDLTAGQSLYALLHARYGVDVATGERVIGTASATELEARHLRLKPGASVLLMRLLAFDRGGRPVEYMTSVNHPQLVAFKTPAAELTW
ncbi:MAG: GntR family transcriptional regulator [Alphaproteobacteria bacterium]|nr:GntR family transcriptional regulator [Alphaproteobacteria bacterium]